MSGRVITRIAVDPKCVNCMYAAPPPETPASYRLLYSPEALECHRYPPVVAEILMPVGNDVRPAMLFPQVDPGDWCGEFQPVNRRPGEA
jgi:hypothetical protein